MTDEVRIPAVDAFWEALDRAWQAGGARSAEAACARLQAESYYSVAPATVRGWLKHKRLPRNDRDVEEMFRLLVGTARTEELIGKLHVARANRVPPKPDQPSPAGPGSLWRRKMWGRVLLWHITVAGVLIVGMAAGMIVISNDQSPLSPTMPTSTTASETARDAEIPQCPSAVIKAVSKKKRARAEFCPDRREFLLYDDDGDNKSAILAVRRNGKEIPAFFNSKGFERRKPDGTIYRVPPVPAHVALDHDDSAEFRVCYGDKNLARSYPEETCSDWTPFWPAS